MPPSRTWCGSLRGRASNAIRTSSATDASGSQYPELQYAKTWSPRDYTGPWQPGNPNPWPVLKGHPLLSSAFCPEVGTQGDLIGVDLSDYLLTWIRPKPTVGGLEVAIGVEPDLHSRGFIGLPTDAVEMRQSEHIFWTTDRIAFAFKLRMGGGFLWTATPFTATGVVIDANQAGDVECPCVVIQNR